MQNADIPRVFLVVVDDSAEMPMALYYATRRARRTGGRVALLHVIPREEESHGLASVEALMKQEARDEAEQLIQKLARTVVDEGGAIPIIHLREGLLRDELLDLVASDPTITVLVLAAGTGPDGPGPLISFLASKAMTKLHIPVTIVPGGLTREQMDTLS
jgi:nucleotide-binding universal stress UspA family protein